MLLDAKREGAIDEAAAAIAAGELVGFPTETVYGLGARADDDAAVARIFERKGRPADHPLIVHVTGLDRVAAFASSVPDVADRLMRTFWPGPLTLILQRHPSMAAAAAGGAATIGLRCPSHPVAQDLLKAAVERNVPGIAAPSANRFGRLSPTCAAHVRREFDDTLTILDGGECDIGIESSIVDCTRGHPVLLRPGMLTRALLEAAAGVALREADEAAPRASGTLHAHYAPNAKLRLMTAPLLHSALEILGPSPLRLAVYSKAVPHGTAPGVIHRKMPDTASAVAHELFSVLRRFDEQGAELIWVEEPPASAEWEGVLDRLHRAAAP